jgi:hypothetical protein
MRSEGQVTIEQRRSVEDLRDAARRVSDATAKAWTEFCGGGYPAADVAAALHSLGDLWPSLPDRAAQSAPRASFAPMLGLVGLPEREAILRAAMVRKPPPEWATTPAALGTGAISDPLAVACEALRSAITFDGAPFDPPSGQFGVDVVASATLPLDYQPSWTDGWRTALLDYHDALALAALNPAKANCDIREVPGVVPRSGSGIEPVVALLLCHLSTATRACSVADLRAPTVLTREGVRGYNLVSTPTGAVAAAQRLGPVSLPYLPATYVEELSAGGLLLWATTEEALLERIESYERAVVLVALLGEWISVIEHVRQDAALESRRAQIIEPLLARAAGVPTATDAGLEVFVINGLRALTIH